MTQKLHIFLSITHHFTHHCKMATCLQQQWPLKDENNKEIILPSGLYWNYVYPYTAVDNRIIINKSQLYSGHRAELDVAFLDKYAGDNNMSMRYIKWLIRCNLDSKTLSKEDHELLLECTKRKWNWDESPPLDVLLQLDAVGIYLYHELYLHLIGLANVFPCSVVHYLKTWKTCLFLFVAREEWQMLLSFIL